MALLPPESSTKNEADAPVDRFRSLAKRLLHVSREELLDAENRYLVKKKETPLESNPRQ